MNKQSGWLDLALGVAVLVCAIATAVRGRFLFTVALLIVAGVFFGRFVRGRNNK